MARAGPSSAPSGVAIRLWRETPADQCCRIPAPRRDRQRGGRGGPPVPKGGIWTSRWPDVARECMKRRWLLKLALFLVLGAIVNVAVAWVCCVHDSHFDELGDYQDAHLLRDTFAWSVWSLRSSRGCLVSSSYQKWIGGGGVSQALGPSPESLIPGWSHLPRSPFAYDLDVRPRQMLVASARGWPLLALCSEMDLHPFSFHALAITDGIPTSRFDEMPGVCRIPVVLPLRPIWPGFAINTVFYAVVLWLLFAGPLVLRRRRRIRRGLCPKCAYPVGTSDVCTECGARVRQP